MQGGLVSTTGGYRTTTVGDMGPPAVTGSPAVPDATTAGQGPGVETSTSVSDLEGMGPIDRLLAGSEWTRDDVELLLQFVSTAILIYWVATEV